MDTNLLPAIVKLAKEAGKEILTIYQRSEKVAVHLKKDQSPLTVADLIANQIIINGLKKLTADWPVLSEESPSIAMAERANWQRYWLVDPLDGTKEFLNKGDDFTVNIALIENQQPVLGVVYIPVEQCCYFAGDQGAFKQEGENSSKKIHTRIPAVPPLIVAASRSHGLNELQVFLNQMGDHTIVNRGSALKFCLVAEGIADLYPRFGPTSEWDTAAGQCIVEKAGGRVTDLTGQVLRYNTKDSLINPQYMVVGDINLNWQKYLIGT